MSVSLIAGGYVWLRTSLPPAAGYIAVQGLEHSVTITRSHYGVPTIFAQNDHDAAFALGFAHAQDRLFQMDVMRRFGAGRLSEWFGPVTLNSDRLTRTIGLYRAAERQYASLAAETRATVTAYAAGINAFLSARTGALPPEYYLLGVRPEAWSAADTLVWGKILDLHLCGNFRDELLRARLSQRLSPGDMAILYPPYPKDAPIPLRDMTLRLSPSQLEALYALLPGNVGPYQDSNNWVTDGKHSASGRPILANDPHLDLTAPGPWYLARIHTPTLTVAGATAPGAPFVLVGHNNRIAWGVTNTMSDVEDVYIEKVDPDDAEQYITPTGPRRFYTHQEEIRVRNAPPYLLTVRSTRHGPVISDLTNVVGTVPTLGQILALRTTWLDDDDHSPDALWGTMRAQDWGAFRDALAGFVAPQLNLVYADVDGNIGLAVPGRVPIRRNGDGWLPVPGWTDDYEWIGFVPHDALPLIYNPTIGRIVTANNKLVSDNYPYFLSRDWEPPYRAQRIAMLLDATPSQSPGTTAAIQADVVSLMAKELLPLMLQITTHSDHAAEAVRRLQAWDGKMERSKSEPLIFVAWLRALNRALFAERLGPIFPRYWDLHPDTIREILVEHREWCGPLALSIVDRCSEQLSASLDLALQELIQRFGDNMNEWSWGLAHEAIFPHPLLSRIPLLRWLFDIEIPSDGGYDTVNNGTTRIWSTTAPYSDVFGPTLRMIIDMANPAQARFMITPGESGNPLSPHYSDLLYPWRNVASIEFDDDASGGTLSLTPARPDDPKPHIEDY